MFNSCIYYHAERLLPNQRVKPKVVDILTTSNDFVFVIWDLFHQLIEKYKRQQFSLAQNSNSICIL